MTDLCVDPCLLSFASYSTDGTSGAGQYIYWILVNGLGGVGCSASTDAVPFRTDSWPGLTNNKRPEKVKSRHVRSRQLPDNVGLK